MGHFPVRLLRTLSYSKHMTYVECKKELTYILQVCIISIPTVCKRSPHQFVSQIGARSIKEDCKVARNKYPEETRNLIIETAGRLFLEKGYEHTSIQDIIDHLGGLSKGAIYHHFKSKEEIMMAVGDKFYASSEIRMNEICQRTDLSGREKLQEVFRVSLDTPAQAEMATVAPDMLKNPQLLAMFLKDSVQGEAPDLLTPIIEEGIRDGTIETDYPRELAEVLMLIGNIWINPMIYQCSTEEVLKKVEFFKYLTEKLGLDVITEDMIEKIKHFSDVFHENERKF